MQTFPASRVLHALAARALEAQPSNVRPAIGFGVEFNITSRPCHVSNVPATVRTVPIHPDDGGDLLGGLTIPDARLGCPYSHFDPKAEVGFQKHKHLYELRGWVTAGWHLWSEAVTNETRRFNYSNAYGTEQRGEGAALTYYGPLDRHNGFNDFVPGVFFKVAKDLHVEDQMPSEKSYGIHRHLYWRADVKGPMLKILTDI